MNISFLSLVFFVFSFFLRCVFLLERRRKKMIRKRNGEFVVLLDCLSIRRSIDTN